MMHVLPDTCRRRLFKNYTFLLWTFVGLQGLNIEKKTEEGIHFLLSFCMYMFTQLQLQWTKKYYMYMKTYLVYIAMITNVIFNNLLLTVNFKVVINVGGEVRVFLMWQSNKMRGY